MPTPSTRCGPSGLGNRVNEVGSVSPLALPVRRSHRTSRFHYRAGLVRRDLSYLSDRHAGHTRIDRQKESRPMRVGFIGLGSMGLAMADNLRRAGHRLSVYNRTRGKAEGLAGVRVAASPGEAAADAEVVITMLADDPAVETTVFGPDGVLDALPAGAVHVGMTTMSHALTSRLARAHEDRGQAFVAAPVFGRPEAAQAAKLWIVAAGASPTVDRCR